MRDKTGRKREAGEGKKDRRKELLSKNIVPYAPPPQRPSLTYQRAAAIFKFIPLRLVVQHLCVIPFTYHISRYHTAEARHYAWLCIRGKRKRVLSLSFTYSGPLARETDESSSLSLSFSLVESILISPSGRSRNAFRRYANSPLSAGLIVEYAHAKRIYFCFKRVARR